ncbi:type I restriction endonuclease subunit R [Nesterenkonia natronophila]|uniref:Type I restriction enzyme endonuclease subunit n=1 Tax=Nesterenkonia natronophila TaxID=2174932 RepID=A0A3A4F0S2_9MICC|nr:type I restriction endonuclease subunit R [Nesterenkonia natronophila]RJN31782.1 type I restriction endonuclease subunit R [Nesterenkonia natronophila]
MRASGSVVRYDPIAVTRESTVVAEYEAPVRSAADYQSEQQLEDTFIAQLQDQAYERLTITSDADLVANLRSQLEALNKVSFTDAEWERFFKTSVSSATEGIVEKARRLHEKRGIELLERDDGTQKNIRLLDISNIHNNRLQVLNQYEAEGAYSNRYDVTVLVNGLPMVHVELKRRGVDIREAFNQISRYQRDSFWAGSGLFEYVQLFVISNGTLTKYYSNTVRDGHLHAARASGRSRKQTSNSYAFTSWWADANNKAITDLVGFTKTFFAKHTLLNILTKYCVFDVDQNLLVMRPYQIVAAERILRRIETASNYKRYGTVAAGGYIWHTTGSGKTLTSFKAAQLASKLETVEKVLFVVDRKDLDYQTQREYDRFEKGAVDGTENTAHLRQRMQDPTSKIVVTTIQKLSRFIEQNPKHPAFGQHVVLIFDECHRSQFGGMHTAITKSFKKYHLFGFTGTPIFADNSSGGGNPQLKTTEQAFGEKLHTYTVVDAVGDKNVLPFRIDYINTIAVKPGGGDSEVSAIDTEAALMHPTRIRGVVDYVLEHFDQKTKRDAQTYRFRQVSNVEAVVRGKGRVQEDRRDTALRGFNSLFAASSIQAAKQYYNTFGKAQLERQAENPSYQPLKIGIIYSFAPNEAQPDGLLPEERFDPTELDTDSRTFLEDAIQDYNDMFSTSWDTTSEGFQGYYKDFSARLKNRELDMAVVVNMFLTGFDATTLNTLWVDKNLRYHGLVQAYSRTNRILNSVKTYGNIVSFRDLKQATDDALALFGNKDAGGVVLLKPYAEYLEEFSNTLEELRTKYPDPTEIPASEEAQKDLIRLQGKIMRLRNILTSFDDFAADNPLPDAEFQDRKSVYLELHRQYREAAEGEKAQIHEDVVFEIELARQDEVNVDYILMLVDKKRHAGGDEDKEIRADIERSVDASPSLRNKKDLILQFVDKVSITGTVEDEWRSYIEQKRTEELHTLIDEENLKPEETESLVADAFRDGAVPAVGTRINTLFAQRSSRFSRANTHGAKKQTVIDKLNTYFERFKGLSE